MGKVIRPVPLNPLAPEELRQFLLVLKRAVEVQGVAVDSSKLIVETTGTADGTYSSNEQAMLNNLKSDVTHLMSVLNALIDSLEGVVVIKT